MSATFNAHDPFHGEPWEAFKQALDEHDRPDHWPASALLVSGWSILSIGRGKDRMKRAADFFEWAYREARDRYRRGFYADPFTKEPVPRAGKGDRHAA